MLLALQLLQVLDRIGGFAALLSIAALLFLARRRQLGRHSLLAAMLAGKGFIFAATTLLDALPVKYLIAFGYVNLLLSVAALAYILLRHPPRTASVAVLLALHMLAFSTALTATSLSPHVHNTYRLYTMYFYGYWIGVAAEMLLWLICGVFAIRVAARALFGKAS